MRTFLLVVTCTLLAGACHKSAVPIAPVSAAPFDSSVTGIWQELGPDSVVLSVFEFRAPEYFVELNTPAGRSPLDAKEPPFRARAFITRVGGSTFINIDELTGRPRAYSFYRFEVKGDTLVGYELNEAAHKFASSQELTAFLSAHLDDPSIYSEPVRFRRVALK